MEVKRERGRPAGSGIDRSKLGRAVAWVDGAWFKQRLTLGVTWRQVIQSGLAAISRQQQSIGLIKDVKEI
jgi:hypothetical protein